MIKYVHIATKKGKLRNVLATVRKKRGCPISVILFNIVLDLSANIIELENKIRALKMGKK